MIIKMRYDEISPMEILKMKKLVFNKADNYNFYLTGTDKNYVSDFLLNKRFRNTKVLKKYCINNKYFIRIFNKNVRTKLNIKEISSNVTSKTNIKKVYRGMGKVKTNSKFPLLVDLYFYNKLFVVGLKDPNEMVNLNEASEYKFNFARNISEFNTLMGKALYPQIERDCDKKVIVLQLDNFKFKMTDFNKKNCTSLIQFYYQYMVSPDTNKNNLEFLFMTNNAFLKINDFSDETTIQKLLIKLGRTDSVIETEDNNVTNNDVSTLVKNLEDIKITDTETTVVSKIKDKVQNTLMTSYSMSYGFDGERKYEEESNQTDIEIEDKIDDAVDNVVKDGVNETEALDELDNNTKLKDELDELVNNRITSRKTATLTKRNQALLEKQKSVQINNSDKTLCEILVQNNDEILRAKEIKTENPNKDMKYNKFSNMHKSYNKNLLESDMLGIFDSLKDKSIPIYIKKIDKVDTTDELNKKYTYTIKLVDTNGKGHTIKFDYPKIVNDSFLFIGGNKKNIINQLMLLPVEKTGPETVQLCSNYNKMFIRRAGAKLAPYIEKFKKFIMNNASSSTNAKIYVELGDCSTVNTDFKTTITFDDLSSMMNKLYINRKNTMIFFNIKTFIKYLDENKIKCDKSKDNIIPIGLENGTKVIYLDSDKDNIIGTDMGFIEYLIYKISDIIPDVNKLIDSINVGKKYMYTNVTIMSHKIPLILLLGYMEGINTTLKKAGIHYEFSDKLVKPTKDNNIIQFNDGYLVCHINDMSDNLLLNGLTTIPTKSYSMDDLNHKETYLDIFDDLLGTRMICNAFDNFYDNFIDNITLSVLKDLKLPRDIVNLCIYGNKLMADNQYIPESNMSHYRLRNNEIINAYLYKIIALAYGKYRVSQVSKNSMPFSIPQDALIKELATSNIVENFSTLGPILEAEKTRAVSYRGPSGMNQERAFTLEKRCYDKSMKGIVSTSTVPSGAVGIVRQLPIDSNISSPRGYLEISNDEDELNSANMLCPAEAITTGCTQYDDGPRQAMVATQTKHVVPAKGYSPLLMSNGADDVLAHIISDDFAFKAKDDGEVIDINNDVAIVKYKNGTYDAIDVGTRIVKNGNGGFSINNKLKLNKKGKFKKDDILAMNDNYFDNIGSDVTYKAGVFAKIAIASDYFCFEDSTGITHKISKKLSTNVTMTKKVVVGNNSNIFQMVKVGDHVKVGDPLITFDQSYDSDTNINSLLSNLSKDDIKDFEDISKYKVKSKYSGVISTIKVYYSEPENTFSHSIRKYIDQVHKPTLDKKKLIKKYTNIENTEIDLEPTGPVTANYGKILGENVGTGVLFVFEISHDNPMKTADKLTFHTALKATVGYIIPEGFEPYSEYRKDEEISTLLSPISILARMTASLNHALFSNKAIVEMTRHACDIYFGK